MRDPYAAKKSASALPFQISDFCLLVVRLLAGISMIYYQVRPHVGPGWRHIWKEREWGLVEQMETVGIPLPSVAATLLVLVCGLAALFFITGFLTRYAAAAMMAALLFVLFSTIEFSADLNPQTVVLHFGLALVLLVGGAGFFSLDTLFTRRRSDPA